MFLSASAKVQDFEWFKYKSARPSTFDRHNKEYDLELDKGMVFGIRFFRRKYRLVLKDDLRIAFVLSEREVKALKKKAVPFKGKIKGVVISPAELLDDSLYHDLNLPPSKAELVKLYNHYNKKLFNNKCPKLTKLVFSRSKKTVAWAQRLPDKTVKMAFNKSYLKSNPKYIIDTLIHEMIHCYQYGMMIYYWEKYTNNGDTSAMQAYRELQDELTPVTRKTSKGKKGTGGHDTVFKEMMHKLNALGYNVTITEKGTDLIESHKDHFVLLFSRDSDHKFIGGFHFDFPFKDKVDEIVEKMKSLYGPTFAYKYLYGKSDYSFASQTIPLTSKGELPNNINFRWYNNVSKAFKELKPEVAEKLETSDNILIQKFKHKLTAFSRLKYREDFLYYAVNVMFSHVGEANMKDIIDDYKAGLTNRIKASLQDRFPEEYKLLVEEYNSVDTRKLIRANNKQFNNLVAQIWTIHSRISGKEELSGRDKDLLGDIHDAWKTGPFHRADKKEFEKALTKKVMKEYPIPEKEVKSYVEHVIYDQGL